MSYRLINVNLNSSATLFRQKDSASAWRLFDPPWTQKKGQIFLLRKYLHKYLRILTLVWRTSKVTGRNPHLPTAGEVMLSRESVKWVLCSFSVNHRWVLNRGRHMWWPQPWFDISLPNSHFKECLQPSPWPRAFLNINPSFTCISKRVFFIINQHQYLYLLRSANLVCFVDHVIEPTFGKAHPKHR